MSMGGIIWGLVSMGEFGRAEFNNNDVSLTTISIGTIHSRRCHFLGGKGSKFGQSCQQEGGRGQKLHKFANVFNGWSPREIACNVISGRIWVSELG